MADKELNHHNHYIINPSAPSSMRYQAAETEEESGGYGEIVEVEGGHIMRSIGKKDRHSKVCTAKGARDRRVRLSALTAIQFYDLQDRLGFDRPSKALDWLINKAKSAIDDLAELPPWNPTDSLRHNATNTKPRKSKTLISSSLPSNVKIRTHPVTMVVGGTEYNQWRQMGEISMKSNELSFLPPSLDSDSIADTIKSFFPVGGGGACASSESPPELIQNYNQPSDLLLQHQSPQLSLQSFQKNPSLLLHHNHHGGAEPLLFSGENNPVELDTSTTEWEQSHHQQNHQSQEFGRIQRVAAESGGGGGFVYGSPPTATSLTPILSHQSQFFTQRSPLQSINTPLIRAWFDPYHIPPAIHQSAAIPGIAFASGEFSGFRIPARCLEEQNDGITNKPSFASSDSRH